MKYVFCLIVIFCTTFVHAQEDEEVDWEYKEVSSRKKNEDAPIAHKLSIGTGIANYNGDLNASFTSINPGKLIAVGFRYFIRKRYTFRPQLTYFSISADDATTGDAVRNLSFTSNNLEWGLSVIYDFVDHQPRWDLRKRFVPYVVGTASGVFFNPKATFNNIEYELHSLQTEGVDYSRVTFSLALGIGSHIAITERSNINLEIRYAYSFSDYLDDVSGNYIDQNSLSAISASLADRTVEGGNIPSETFDGIHWKSGSQRGSTSLNDRYLFMVVEYEFDIFNHKVVYPAF